MATTKVEFEITTAGPVAADEIATAIFHLFRANPFPYRKPFMIRTTETGTVQRTHAVVVVNGEPIGVTDSVEA